MAGLLVSVRSVDEAVSALAGGATIIDIKEPDRGPLGRADSETWTAIRRAVPGSVPVSVALGELKEWEGVRSPDQTRFAGIRYRKIGLAGVGADWSRAWTELRRRWGPGPSWVAVAYADWSHAGSPSPDDVLADALAADDCAGVLVDTWDKSRSALVDESWIPWFARARLGGRLTALAGGLDEASIARLAILEPDLFAVRGAACVGGNRNGPIDSARVAALVRAVSSGRRVRFL